MELYLRSPCMPSGRGAKLKHRDNFTFIFTLKSAKATAAAGSGTAQT